MTPAHSAARADIHQMWSTDLRISEVIPAAADSSVEVSRRSQPQGLSLAATYLQTAWRWLERKHTQHLSSRRLRVAETISLGEKRSVSIVQVDGAQFLIGCSTGSVQLLAVLDKPDGVATARSGTEHIQ